MIIRLAYDLDMTTDHDDEPISPPPLPDWATVSAPPGTRDALYPPTDLDPEDWTHPVRHASVPDDDMPDVLTPLDRVNPLTGRGPGVREFGTITGRLRPNGPTLQPIPERVVDVDAPRHVDAHRVLKVPVDAAELLEEAARLIDVALNTDPMTAAEAAITVRAWNEDGARWLRRFRRDVAR